MEKEKKEEMKIRIEVCSDFNLEKAVCNHGFFMMAPNNWLPSTKTLVRPLRLLPNRRRSSVTASIHQPPNQTFLTVTLQQLNSHCEGEIPLSHDDLTFIRCQVKRMLHISKEDERVMQEFYKLNPAAKQIGFGRIFRSPSLFEDIVKSVLLCFSSWNRSLDMAEALCNLQHKLFSCSYYMKKGGKKRKRRLSCDCKVSNFPSAEEIASLDLETLKRECNLGFRASTILQLAQNIENGTLKLENIDEVDPAKSHATLSTIRGIGNFVVANVMMCLGFYQYIPIDTETVKHLEQVHGKTNLKNMKAQKDVIAQIYDQYAPFQCLVYWMERVEFYEKQLGKLSELPNSRYRHVTSTNIQNVVDRSSLTDLTPN